MRILQIISSNDKYGAQRIFLDQVAALRDLGHDVFVAARGEIGYVADSVRAMGVPYHGFGMNRIQDVFSLRRLVKSRGIEIIHSTLDRADYFGLVTGRTCGIPVVSTMMVPRCHHAYRFMDRVAVLSNKQRDILLAKGVSSSKIKLIRPGIDVNRFSNPDSRKREEWKIRTAADNFEIVFCHISSMLPRKAHRVSLEMTHACRERGVKPLLFIIGDPLEGDYVASLKQYITKHGLEANVVFTGWTTEVPEILSLCHFTLLPSADEALGVVLMEGMAAGTPIVAREGEGGAELIAEYGAGCLYRPDHGIAPLVDQILLLSGSREQYDRLRERCKVIAAKEFSMNAFGSNLIENLYPV